MKSQIRHLTSNINGMLNNYDNKKLGELFDFNGAKVRAELERQKEKGYKLIPSDNCKHFCSQDGCKCRYWQNKTILKVIVKRECFDLMEQGIKKKEYRELKDYWIKRLTIENKENVLIKNYTTGKYTIKKFDAIEIKNGYQSKAPVLLFEIKNINIEKPNKDWVCGLFNNSMMFSVELGREIARLNCL